MWLHCARRGDDQAECRSLILSSHPDKRRVPSLQCLWKRIRSGGAVSVVGRIVAQSIQRNLTLQCARCHSGGIYTNPQNGREMTCAAFQETAFAGVISPDNCKLVPQFVPNCGCQESSKGFKNPPCNICGNGNAITKP
jgi:hypothetical protein